MIEVSGLSKLYSGTRAVEGLSFAISQGEIIGLLGLNGAGKTTVLKVLGCYLLPTAGKVEVHGYSVTENPQKVREQIGYLPDKPPLYPEMTVKAYLQFVAQLKNVARKSIDLRVQQVVDDTNLGEVLLKKLGDLSHGFQQRVGIAQALVHNPSVVILDEPINGLDPVQIVEMRDLILGLRGKHTVILSSHILSEVTKTCDRILVLDQGKLMAEGREQDLYNLSEKIARICVEIDGQKDYLVEKIKTLDGVKNCQAQITENRTVFHIETTKESRSLIAKSIVDAGEYLLTLSMQEDGLETIFLQMVSRGGAS